MVVCLVLMGMVWFGLAALQTRLAGMAVSDNTEEEALNRWQEEGFIERDKHFYPQTEPLRKSEK